MKKEQRSGVSFGVYILLMFLVFIIVIADKLYEGLSLLLLIIIICLVLFFRAKGTYKYIVKGFSIFFLFHLVLFPTVYLILINFNPHSFEFDNFIKSTEKKQVLIKIENEFKQDDIKVDKTLLKELINYKDSLIDSTINYLSSGNVVVLKDYIISYDRPFPIIDSGESPIDIFYICNSQGTLVSKFEIPNNYKEKPTLRVILRNYLNSFDIKESDFKRRKYEIVKLEKYWNYNNILAYSINIFSKDNIIPKSRIANVIFFIHHLLVYGFILGLVFQLGFNFFTFKKE
jgi:hypothetical protein